MFKLRKSTKEKQLSELDKLEKYLKDHGYNYERVDGYRGSMKIIRHQVVVYKDGRKDWDAVCQHGSCGFEQGLLEIMGSIVDKETDGSIIVGFLTANDVIDRIEQKENINERL